MAFKTHGLLPGMTQDVYEGMFQQVGAKLRVAPGFIAHIANATDDGWEVIEVWESEAAAMGWLNDNVYPMMRAAGAPLPELHGRPVHNLVLAGK